MSSIELDAGVPVLAVTRYTLPSGLEVVLHPEPRATEVAVHVAYRVGSSDEAPGGSGRAHLFEHLFKNSAHLGARTHYAILRELGGRGNASTGVDVTRYHCVVPPAGVPTALWIESDRMGYLLPGLGDARIAAQREVVRAERRQRYEAVPFGEDTFALSAALYPPDHPLRPRTIGEHADIAATTRADLERWYRTYYVPANAVLVIAGAITVDEARAEVERYFGTFPASTRPPRARPPTPTPTPARLTRADRRAAYRRLHRAWLGPADGDPARAALTLLGDLLARPGVGVAWRRLVYERAWAQRLGASGSGGRLGGEWHLTCDLRPDAEVERVRDALGEVLAEVGAGAVDEAAVARVRVGRLAAALWGLESMAHRAARLADGILVDDCPQWWRARARRLEAADAAAVVAAARRYLAPSAMVELLTTPASA
ncbi:MAG: pitrilysin family protein [Kofleriaceae bacterium]